MDLIQDVKKRLMARKGDWLEISKSAGISYSWIVKFADDQITNPGYLTLLKLRSHLTKKTKK
jgi:hypothetical protein